MIEECANVSRYLLLYPAHVVTAFGVLGGEQCRKVEFALSKSRFIFSRCFVQVLNLYDWI